MDTATYSRVVSTLKIVLPMIALVVLGTVFLITKEDGFDPGFSFSQADFEALNEGNGLTNPRITGKTDTGAVFTLSASLIALQSAGSKALNAENIVARVATDNGNHAEIMAELAVLDIKNNTLHLPLGGHLVTSDGYTAQVDSVLFNLKSGEITGDLIDADGDIGQISADNFRILVTEDENRVLWFENNVRVTLTTLQEE